MPFCFVEDPTLGQFAFLVTVEVELARHAVAIMPLSPQYEKRHQDEDDYGNGYYDDPFHGELVAGGPGLVILPELSGSYRRENHLPAKGAYPKSNIIVDYLVDKPVRQLLEEHKFA